MPHQSTCTTPQSESGPISETRTGLEMAVIINKLFVEIVNLFITLHYVY